MATPFHIMYKILSAVEYKSHERNYYSVEASREAEEKDSSLHMKIILKHHLQAIYFYCLLGKKLGETTCK